MTEDYKKYEFCKAVDCNGIRSHLDESVYCAYYTENCLKTAKEFHKWLKSKGFKIVKDTI